MIRPARRRDARALAELEVRAWRWAYPDPVEAQTAPSVEAREARWAEQPLDGAFVWELDGRVMGVVEVGTRAGEPGTGALLGLCVEPAAQGAGLGSALHDHAVAQLRAAGHRDATLWVSPGNGHARAFYEARGWCDDGATGEPEGVPHVRYRRALDR